MRSQSALMCNHRCVCLCTSSVSRTAMPAKRARLELHFAIRSHQHGRAYQKATSTLRDAAPYSSINSSRNLVIRSNPEAATRVSLGGAPSNSSCNHSPVIHRFARALVASSRPAAIGIRGAGVGQYPLGCLSLCRLALVRNHQGRRIYVRDRSATRRLSGRAGQELRFIFRRGFGTTVGARGAGQAMRLRTLAGQDLVRQGPTTDGLQAA